MSDNVDEEILDAAELLTALISRARPGSKGAFISWVRSIEDELMIKGQMVIQYSKDKNGELVEVSSRQGVSEDFAA